VITPVSAVTVSPMRSVASCGVRPPKRYGVGDFEAVELVGRFLRDGGRARCDDVGRIGQDAAGGNDELAELAEVKCLGDE
jgi:hypothetical protein